MNAFRFNTRPRSRAGTRWRDLPKRVRTSCKGLIQKITHASIRRRNNKVRTQQPGTDTEGYSVADGNPGLDAIRGNRMIQLWGKEGIPGARSLQTRDDGGATLVPQTSDLAGPPSTPPPGWTTAHAGGWSGQDADSRPGTIDDSDVTVDSPDPVAEAELKLKAMDCELRDSSCDPFGGPPPKFYIPNDSLRRIMNDGAIRQILPCIAGRPAPDRADALVYDICGRSSKDQKATPAFRKVLAILILIGKANTIAEFVDAGIADTSLPLRKLGASRLFQLCPKDSEEAIPLFSTWDHRDIENFENSQWETQAPFFSREGEGDEDVKKYKLTQHHPLPFEIINEGVGTSNGSSKPTMPNTTADTTGDLDLTTSGGHAMNGGYGKVWKVKIHRAHHKLTSYRGNETNPALAIKRLRAADPDAFENEVGILSRLNRDSDPHLVKLLLAMVVEGGPGKDMAFYLMFPLADGNLNDFWKLKCPHPSEISPVQYARWAAEQFLGLAGALGKLHDLHEQHRHSPEGKAGDGDPFYGIHGDIKPANLLWYSEWVGPSQGGGAANGNAQEGGRQGDSPASEALGVLQLADFGISKMYHTGSRSNADLRAATKTYAAPEVEWGAHHGSRSFDIWSLGAVFLEFVCWLVLRRSAIEDPIKAFEVARSLDMQNKSMAGTAHDAFYHIVLDKDKAKFEVNPAVQKMIKRLQDDPNGSDFVDDILRIILNDMLVVEPRKTSMAAQQQQGVKIGSGTKGQAARKRRITCIRLVEKLAEQKWDERKDEYFTTRSPGRPRPISGGPPQVITIPARELETSRRASIPRPLSIGERKPKGDSSKHEQQQQQPQQPHQRHISTSVTIPESPGQ